MHITRGTEDVPRVRHELIARLRAAAIATDLDCVGLVLTELLTNALVHGSLPVEVHAHTDGDRVRVEVCDGSANGVPHRRMAEPTDVTGRGLMLVAGLVDRWGVEPSGTGKVVWAEFAGSDELSSARHVTDQAGATSIDVTSGSSSDHRSSTSQDGVSTPPISAMPVGQLRTMSQ